VKVNGRPIKNARESIRAGLGLVPEDRAHKGLVLAGSVQDNIVLASLKQVLRFGLRSDRAERLLAERMTAELGVKSSSLQVAAGTLSGGNQQKLSLAKWLAHRLDVLLIDEPTRGVDVGSKAEIHSLIRQLADEGVAVVVVSSDMRELLSLPDRILVMREGRLVGSMEASDATEESVISLASGVKAA
jgi:ABC-type sugar transport system ATPase subunit